MMSAPRPLTQPSPQGEGFGFLLLAPLGGRGRVRGALPRRRLEGEGFALLLLSPLGRGRVRGQRRLAGEGS